MSNHLIERKPELYFDSIHNELNNFLRDMFLPFDFSNSLNVRKDSIWRPAIEVKENDKNYKIKVQLAGVKKEDIKVDLDNDFMTISAEMREEKEIKDEEEKNEKFNTSEFRYGRYQRTISFDTPVKYEDSSAKFNNGILLITVPKQKVEKSSKKTLEIKD